MDRHRHKSLRDTSEKTNIMFSVYLSIGIWKWPISTVQSVVYVAGAWMMSGSACFCCAENVRVWFHHGFTTKSYFYHFQSYDEFLADMQAGAHEPRTWL